MKISDEKLLFMLREQADKVLVPVYGDLPPDNYMMHFSKRTLLEFARKLIALAQEVKPLDFKQINPRTKQADTVVGSYYVADFDECVRMAYPEDICLERSHSTEAEAIEAANIDYKRRVLSCLVNGGV